jgi:hypothetical protein
MNNAAMMSEGGIAERRWMKWGLVCLCWVVIGLFIAGSGLSARLYPARFLRIRHSTIVNIEGVKELRPLFRGEYLIVLRDGTELTSSRRYRKNLDAILTP